MRLSGASRDKTWKPGGKVCIMAASDISSRGRSSMVEHQLPKLNTGVRFPSPALWFEFQLNDPSSHLRTFNG